MTSSRRFLDSGQRRRRLFHSESSATAIFCSGLDYGFTVSYVILKVIDMTLGLRVNEEEEREGLDVSLHGEHVE
jgi:ammonia channel protein AmtB